MGNVYSPSLAHEARKIRIRELRQSKNNPLSSVATMVGLSKTAIYPLLREIAEEDNVPYKSLLDFPHEGYNREAPYVSHKPQKADAQAPSVESISDPLDELLAVLQDMKADCENMLTVLNNIDTL